jgi:hypothetical protein
MAPVVVDWAEARRPKTETESKTNTIAEALFQIAGLGQQIYFCILPVEILIFSSPFF